MPYTRLSLPDREVIAIELAKGSTYSHIAYLLSPSVSTISREVSRH
jgi:IS30 family transposase